MRHSVGPYCSHPRTILVDRAHSRSQCLVCGQVLDLAPQEVATNYKTQLELTPGEGIKTVRFDRDQQCTRTVLVLNDGSEIVVENRTDVFRVDRNPPPRDKSAEYLAAYGGTEKTVAKPAP